MEPRFIRAMQAPAYLGMCRAEFNKVARPHLPEIAIGKQGIAFDRHDLDRFADQLKQTNAIDKPTPSADDSSRDGRSHAQRGATQSWHANNKSAASPKNRLCGNSCGVSNE
jgi:hypothetical protein